jgi:ABC-2 type transport system permease protein
MLDLALKDLTQIARDKRSLFFLVGMPIVFTLFMGFTYQSGAQTAPADSRLALGWVNNDPGGLLSQPLFELLSNSDSVRLVELKADTAAEAVRQNKVAGALVVPTGYSEQIMAGHIAQLSLIADTTTSAGQSLFQALRAPITQLLASVETARLSAEIIGDSNEFHPSLTAALHAWAEVKQGQLVTVEMAVAQPEEPWYGDTPYNQASPGILVQFAIFGLMTSGQVLLQERKSHTWQRLQTTALPTWQIVAGHLLALFAVVFAQEVLLVAFGQLALGVNYMREPLGTLAVSIGLGLWVAATGLLIGVLAKNDSQVVLFSLMGMFIFSALGGTWFPLEASSGAFAALGRLLPSAWAMTGFQNILVRGLGVESLGLPLLALVAYAFAFSAIALWRFKLE